MFTQGFQKTANALTRYMARKSPGFSKILAKNKSKPMAPHKMKQWKENAVSMFSGKDVPEVELELRGVDRYLPKNTPPTKSGIPAKSGKVVLNKNINHFRTPNASTFLHERGHHDNFMHGGYRAALSETKAWDWGIQQAKKTNNKELSKHMLNDAKSSIHGTGRKYPAQGIVNSSDQIRAGLAGKMKSPEMRKLQRELKDKKKSPESSVVHTSVGEDRFRDAYEQQKLKAKDYSNYKASEGIRFKPSWRRSIIDYGQEYRALEEDVKKFGKKKRK